LPSSTTCKCCCGPAHTSAPRCVRAAHQTYWLAVVLWSLKRHLTAAAGVLRAVGLWRLPLVAGVLAGARLRGSCETPALLVKAFTDPSESCGSCNPYGRVVSTASASHRAKLEARERSGGGRRRAAAAHGGPELPRARGPLVGGAAAAHRAPPVHPRRQRPHGPGAPLGTL